MLRLDAYFGHVRASSVAMFADVYVYAPGGHACSCTLRCRPEGGKRFPRITRPGGDALS